MTDHGRDKGATPSNRNSVTPVRPAGSEATNSTAPRQRSTDTTVAEAGNTYTFAGFGGFIAARAQAKRLATQQKADNALALRAARSTNHQQSWFLRLLAWLRALPRRTTDALLGSGVTVGWWMALAGSGLGQFAWWSIKVPAWLAVVFCFAFEALMIGCSRRARSRRMKNRAALPYRLFGLAVAFWGARTNYVHMSSPETHITIADKVLIGDPNVGLGFALMTALGFLVHEIAESMDVNDHLRDNGLIKPLGKRWIFFGHAVRARLLLIDQPSLTADAAWEQTRRQPGKVRWTIRTAFALGRRSMRAPHWTRVRTIPENKAAAPKAPRLWRDQRAPQESDQGTAPRPQTASRRQARTDQSTTNRKTSTAAASAVQPNHTGEQGTARVNPITTPPEATQPTSVRPINQAHTSLEWIHQQLQAGRVPSPQEIIAATGVAAGTLRTYMGRWEQRGALTQEEITQIKAARNAS